MSAPRIAWSWPSALLGALYVLPGAVIAAGDPRRGISLAVGVIPAAAIGVLPARKRRVLVATVGALVGVSMLIGSALSGLPVLAVLAVFALGVGAALLAARKPVGRIVMTLALPLVGIGLSYDDVSTGAGLALLMALGGIYAWLISLVWPQRPARAGALPTGPTPNLAYGIRLGAAGAIAAALGFALDLEHVGWACGAALLVMRPAPEMQALRSVGRVASVLVGAILGVTVIKLSPPEGWYGLLVAVPVVLAAATRGSRWYVMPAFTTFLVMLLLLYADPTDASVRFTERVTETIIGVGLAFVFGVALPALAQNPDPADGITR